ncbi:MoxR family ATPase [Thermococci archaeon]|nr:MAG: MoxR family ATPase [Thermococci archaeon]RLF96771.1 MAG: MoxR family ATPase [Thermococci archaeon]
MQKEQKGTGLEEIVREIQQNFGIVGRDEEIKKAIAAKMAGKHLLIEGEVGTGKTTLAVAISKYFNQPLFRIDGDERMTEAKLVGHFDPPMVVRKGYTWEAFVPGPLVRAMKEGGILFINELNRLPEGTQNVLLPAMDEGKIYIPKLGEINAKDGFTVIATENPSEHVGTTPLSEAIRDRFVLISLEYQSEDEEIEIVTLRSGCSREIAEKSVKITRLTREHPDIKRGSSVRGAIDIASLVEKIGNGLELSSWIDASLMALSTKIELNDGTNRSIREIIEEIVLKAIKDFPGGREELGLSMIQRKSM